jgi:hypothetical protein
MSDSADLSRVIALAHKAAEVVQKAHYARAAEKFRLAAEEAEKALLLPDCLVTYSLRLRQLNALLRHATSPATPADADHALRDACLRLLPSVMAVLDRRKAAGTLLPGSCRRSRKRITWLQSGKPHYLLATRRLWLQRRRAAELAPYVWRRDIRLRRLLRGFHAEEFAFF